MAPRKNTWGKFQEEMEVAWAALTSAGQLAVRLQERPEALQVGRKAGDEPVSNADRDCSALLVESLSSRFPSDRIISEESSPQGPTQSSRQWFVDPIDGTGDFLRGLHSFSMLIGLALDGVPTLGLVHQPNCDLWFWAVRGFGAWCGGKAQPPSPLRAASQTDLHHALIPGLGQTRAPRPSDSYFAGLADEHIGSFALKMCTIAAGSFDVYANPMTRCSLWDTCGVEVLLRESGNRISDVYGKDLRYRPEIALRHPRGIVVGNPQVHTQALAKLQPLLARR